MKNIKDFRIDLNSDSLENIVKIKESIDVFANQPSINTLCLELSIILEIPNKIIKKKFKQIIYGRFDYYDNDPKFKLNYNLLRSLKYTLFFSFFIFFGNLKKLKKDKKKMSIILDNVEGKYVIEKFNKILSFFKNPLILIKNPDLERNSCSDALFFNSQKNNFSNKILKSKKIILLKFLIKLVKISFQKKIDLINLFFIIFYTSLKYYRIFSIFESKYFIHDRIYHTCAVRNYLFKKNKGSKIFCLQSHLAEGTISVFSDIDILFTFGKEKDTEKKLKLLGGDVNQSIPSGSLRMESELKDDKKFNNVKNIDILFIGINPAIWRGTSKKILEIYYEQLKWVNEISKKFPTLKIVNKHHPNFLGDPEEKKIFDGSNIKTIIKPEDNLNSYNFLLKSKLILSFSSTMVLEGLSLGKKCFFLDPKLKNTTFFGGLDYLSKIRITKFDELERLIKKNLLDNQENLTDDSERFCLSHNTVSEVIYRHISSF